MPDKILSPLELEASDFDTSPERLQELAQIAALAPLVAANPASAAETLRALATHADKRVRMAVAENPNAPFELLRVLMEEHPERVLHNPALPFLLIENPSLPGRLSENEMLATLRFAHIPRVFVAHALSLPNEEIRAAAMMHIAVAGEAGPNWKDELIHHIGETIKLDPEDAYLFQLPDLFSGGFLDTLAEHPASHPYLGHNPNLSPTALALILSGKSDKALLALARNPGATLEMLDAIALTAQSEVGVAVAEHPNASNEILALLAHHDHPLVRGAVAQRTTLSSASLRHLASDLSEIVRGHVARNPATPTDVCAMLAGDVSAYVRASVARNESTPIASLERLARDSDVHVRSSVLLNPQAPKSLIEGLAREDMPEMLIALADSPHVTAEIVRRLIATKQHALQEAIAANPALPRETLTWLAGQTGNRSIVRGLARNPSASPDILLRLTGHKNMIIWCLVAANPAIPFVAQGRLAETRDEPTHLALARNPATLPSVLSRLYEQASPEQLVAMARHPAMNTATRRSIYTDYFNVALKNAADLPKMRSVALAANIAIIPENVHNVDAIDWMERLIIAHSTRSPKWVLMRLSQDGNRFVRAAARNTLINQKMTSEKD